jgi:hypothetical protein
MTIFGITMGSVSRPSSAACRRKRWRWKARAAAVPMAVARVVATAVMSRLLRSAARIWVLWRRRAYQSKMNPRHCAVSRSRLNENKTKTASGA